MEAIKYIILWKHIFPIRTDQHTEASNPEIKSFNSILLEDANSFFLEQEW